MGSQASRTCGWTQDTKAGVEGGPQEAMGFSVEEVVRKPPKPVPEEVAKRWARELAKEGKNVDWQGLMPPRGYVALARRWVVERTFSYPLSGQEDEQRLREAMC